jgi:hypothetical protein
VSQVTVTGVIDRPPWSTVSSFGLHVSFFAAPTHVVPHMGSLHVEPMAVVIAHVQLAGLRPLRTMPQVSVQVLSKQVLRAHERSGMHVEGHTFVPAYAVPQPS